MKKILLWNNFKEIKNLSNDFIYNFINDLNESSPNIGSDLNYNKIFINKLIKKDIDLDKLIPLIKNLIPLFDKLIKNQKIRIKSSKNNLFILTLALIGIILRENREKFLSKNDIRNLLEELKLMGIGNGIVKKLMPCLESLIEISVSLSDHVSDKKLEILMDLNIILPVISSIIKLVDRTKINIDEFPSLSKKVVMGISNLSDTDFITILNKISNFDENKTKKIKKIGDIRDSDYESGGEILLIDRVLQ